MQIIIIFSIAILSTVASQLLFKMGMLSFKSVDFSVWNICLIIKHVFTSPFLLSGLFLYAMSFLLWLFILAKVKLSVAYPITSLNFVLVLLLSYYFFGEKLTMAQYFGVVLIIFGVWILFKA